MICIPWVPLAGIPQNRQTGFTLLELMVVIAIAALAIGIAAANYSGSSASAQLKKQSRQLVSVLRRERVQALSASLVTGVEAVEGGAGYRILSDDRVITLPDAFTFTLASAQTQENLRPDSILYFPDGSSTGGRGQIASPEGQVAIAVNWLTGEVSLAEQ